MTAFTPFFQALDANGDPYSGAKLNFYITATSTPKNTYSDAGLTTPNANPVVADSAGRFGPIYLATDANYKVILATSTDVTIATFDPVQTTSDITGLTALTAPATDDELSIYDLSAAAIRKITLANLLKVVNGLTEDTSPDNTADYLLTYDTSAAAAKRTLGKRAGSLVPLTAIDVAGASAADIVLDTTNHRALLIFLDAIVVTSDGANLLSRVSTDGGSSFLSTSTYLHARGVADSTPTIAGAGTGAGDPSIPVASALDSTASQNLSGLVVVLIGGAAAHATKIFNLFGYVTSGALASAGFGYGSNLTSSQVNAIRFLPSTSTFASGTIRPYAILK